MITLGFWILLAYSCLFFRIVFLGFKKFCTWFFEFTGSNIGMKTLFDFTNFHGLMEILSMWRGIIVVLLRSKWLFLLLFSAVFAFSMFDKIMINTQIPNVTFCMMSGFWIYNYREIISAVIFAQKIFHDKTKKDWVAKFISFYLQYDL